MANRITKILTLFLFFFFLDVKMYSVRLLNMWSMKYKDSFRPDDSFHDLLGKASVLPKLTATPIWHTGKKILIESWVAWIALPTYYSHTRCFTALQNWLALPIVCSGKLLARSEKHEIFIGQQWKQICSVRVMSSQIYKEVSTYVFFTSLQGRKCKYNRLLVIGYESRE